jgi:hypothetical protein
MAKHRITKLKLSEISGVDRPAQPGATVQLMKRAEPPKEPETPMFKTREELLAAIAKSLTDPAYATANQAEIMKAATTLNALDVVPQSISKAAPATDPALIARLEKSDKIIALSAIHKAHYDSLSDDAAKDAFLAKDASGRDAAIALTKGDDPVVYTTLDGTDIRKSAGDLVVQLAKSNDQLRKDLLVEKAARTDQDLAKRAETDISKMAGDIDTRKALLKAVDGIADQKTRDEVMKSLRAANAAMGGAFAKNGRTGGADDKDETDPTKMSKAEAEAKLDELAKAHATATKVDFAKAYSAVLDTDEGRALYKALA